MKTITFTGHRPSKLALNARQDIKDMLQAITYPYKIRIGMALGADTLCAEACIELGKPFEAWLPCPNQHSRLHLLKFASKRVLVSPKYFRGCMQKRNKAMVNGSNLLIAYYNNNATGGTAYTVKKASEQNIPILFGFNGQFKFWEPEEQLSLF